MKKKGKKKKKQKLRREDKTTVDQRYTLYSDQKLINVCTN